MMYKVQKVTNAPKQFISWLNRLSLFALALLSLLAVLLIQPGYANDLSGMAQVNHYSWLPNPTIGIISAAVGLGSLIVCVPWKKIQNNREDFLDQFLDDVSLWLFFSLGIALLPLAVESLKTENCHFRQFLGSPDILIVITALVGASVGDLVIVGRKEQLSHWYTCVVGSGMLCAMFAGHLYGQISNHLCSDIANNAIGNWSIGVFAFSCIYTLLAKAIGATVDLEDAAASDNGTGPNNNGANSNNNGTGPNNNGTGSLTINPQGASANAPTATAQPQPPEEAAPDSRIIPPKNGQKANQG